MVLELLSKIIWLSSATELREMRIWRNYHYSKFWIFVGGTHLHYSLQNIVVLWWMSKNFFLGLHTPLTLLRWWGNLCRDQLIMGLRYRVHVVTIHSGPVEITTDCIHFQVKQFPARFSTLTGEMWSYFRSLGSSITSQSVYKNNKNSI